MKQRSAYAALGLIAILTVLATGAGAVNLPAPVSEKVRQLRDDYFRALHEAHQARRSAATPEDGIRLYHQKLPNPSQYVEKCLELARLNPSDPGQVDALVAAVEFSDVAWNWKDETVRPISAIQMLADRADDPKLAEALPYLKDLYNPAARDLLRAIAKKNRSRDVRGQALFMLAMSLKEHAELLEIFRESAQFRADLEKSNGTDWLAPIVAAKPAALQTDAISLLEESRDQFADVKVNDEPIGPRAGRALFQLRRLGIGQVAPEIAGRDENGSDMRLSDDRGKVVMLVFWGGWCGSCMAEVPRERELVKRMAGKPFVLLGINSDQPDQVKQIVQKHQINWNSWVDGTLDGPQPIAKAWNIGPWPKVYLLDATGVIRYNELNFARDDEMNRAVDALIAEVRQL
jgi:peroxiredoxin